MHIRFPTLLLLSSATFSLAYSASYVKIRGHDISSSIVHENAGMHFKLDGVITPLEKILTSGGANYVRSRLWVDPSDGNYNLQYNLKLGKKAMKAGLGFYLGIHYSGKLTITEKLCCISKSISFGASPYFYLLPKQTLGLIPLIKLSPLNGQRTLKVSPILCTATRRTPLANLQRRASTLAWSALVTRSQTVSCGKFN